MSFADNLKKLPGISHLAAINLLDADGNVVAAIENKAGSQGSLARYNHLAQTTVSINAEAAKKAWRFSPSMARTNGPIRANPNIARLLQIEAGAPALRVKHVFAV